MSRPTRIAHPIMIAVSAMLVTACSDEDLTGTYAAACDPLVTIHFQAGGVADVNRNFCEGYGSEAWDYAVDGDTVQMALKGKLFDSSSVQVKLEISSADELTALSDTGFLTCNNCSGNEVWTKK